MSTVANEHSHQLPGALQATEAPELVLHTHLGQMLFTGRKPKSGKHEIVGLLRFASQVRLIWNGACNNDPYADWWLVKLDRALELASERLRIALEQAKSHFVDHSGVSLPLSVSANPLRYPLQFTSPYAYRGAYLIADLDLLARAIMSARHYALITTNDHQRRVMLAGRSVRSAFLVAMPYKLTGVTREDVKQENSMATAAQNAMGSVPADVFTGKTRARYAPTVPTRRDKVAEVS